MRISRSRATNANTPFVGPGRAHTVLALCVIHICLGYRSPLPLIARRRNPFINDDWDHQPNPICANLISSVHSFLLCSAATTAVANPSAMSFPLCSLCQSCNHFRMLPSTSVSSFCSSLSLYSPIRSLLCILDRLVSNLENLKSISPNCVYIRRNVTSTTATTAADLGPFALQLWWLGAPRNYACQLFESIWPLIIRFQWQINTPTDTLCNSLHHPASLVTKSPLSPPCD